MKDTILTFAPLAMRPPEAAAFLGLSRDLLLRCKDAGWITPKVKSPKLTLYETADLRELWKKIKEEGMPK